MTTAQKVACSQLLVIQNDYVVVAQNFDTGCRVSSALGAIFLDETNFVPTYIVGVKLYEPLARFNELVQNSVPGWRMRITNRRRHAYFNDGQVRVSGRFFVDYMCIDRKLTKNKRIPRLRVEVINLDLLFATPPVTPEEQLDAAIGILELCENRGIGYKSTKGAIGSAMLKASPFWIKGRYAAPKFINDRARKYLPGNFYSVSRRVRTEHIAGAEQGHFFHIPHCYYIDQTSAHHTIVSQIHLPAPDSVHARGNFDSTDPERWCELESPTGRKFTDGTHVGLLLCKVQIATMPPTKEHLYPQWARKRGSRYVWIWTPELRLFENDHRLQLEHICAAFTGTTYDPVLPEYAKWSMEELERDKKRAQYKKGPLLAAYGMLAFNSTSRTAIYRYWGGENRKLKVEIPLAGMVGESKIKIPDSVELSTVNVVARGLIEAETRTRSIEYARELDSNGLHIPQIYADGILVATDQLPFVPEGWRVSHSLTDVHIPRPNAIISRELIKLPGVAGSEQDREWERTRERAMVVVDRMIAV